MFRYEVSLNSELPEHGKALLETDEGKCVEVSLDYRISP